MWGPLLGFPLRRFLFTHASTRVVYSRWLLIWIQVPWILRKAYAKVNWYICRNKVGMGVCIEVVDECISNLKKLNFVKPSFDFLFGISYFHMFLHELLIRDGLLFEFKCLKFCKMLMWKLSNIFAETNAEWVHKVVNGCISNLENINFAKPSLGSFLGTLYSHMLPHELLIRDGFLFEFKCLKFCKRLMWK